jgi:hypothetical protein
VEKRREEKRREEKRREEKRREFLASAGEWKSVASVTQPEAYTD